MTADKAEITAGARRVSVTPELELTAQSALRKIEGADLCRVFSRRNGVAAGMPLEVLLGDT